MDSSGQLDFLASLQGAPRALVEPTPPQVLYKRSLRARHYRLTLRQDGTAIATIPAHGTEQEARRFVAKHQDWLKRTRERHPVRPKGESAWFIGTHVLWRGEATEIRSAATAEARPSVCLAADVFRVPSLTGDLRPTLEAHFRRRAQVELTARTWELAAETGIEIKKVVIRNQRTRWGSCSSSGAISLNWRLIRAPAFVSDYVIYHELVHRREMNHSRRFWSHVAKVCPPWKDAERWLKQQGPLLGL